MKIYNKNIKGKKKIGTEKRAEVSTLQLSGLMQ